MTSMLFRIVRICFPNPNAIIFKTKYFSDCVVTFLEATSNFKHFEEKDDLHSYFISQITDCERLS